MAFCHALKRVRATTTAGQRLDMWWRATICYRKFDSAWLVTHEHASVPLMWPAGAHHLTSSHSAEEGGGPMAILVDERALDERLAQLEAARSWSPRIVSRLEALIRTDDDAALFRVNPFTFASERDLDQDESIDLFLHAAAHGLFEMDWLLICPRCACAVESFARLRAVLRRFRCPECHNEYEAAMDDFIAIYFNVSPQICATRYQRPETLDPFDYMFIFKGVREGYRPNGQPYLDSVREALRGLGFLEPGGTATFAFEAAEGTLFGGSSDTNAGFVLQVGTERSAEPQRLRLTYLGTGYQPDKAVLAAGPVVIEVENATSSRGVLGILQAAPGDEDAFLHFAPISQASTCSPARRSRACSGRRWSVARRASRSVTSRSCSRTSGDRPRSINGSVT